MNHTAVRTSVISVGPFLCPLETRATNHAEPQVASKSSTNSPSPSIGVIVKVCSCFTLFILSLTDLPVKDTALRCLSALQPEGTPFLSIFISFLLMGEGGTHTLLEGYFWLSATGMY